MKKVALFVTLIQCIVLLGCTSTEFSQSDAISKAIHFHNASKDVNSNIDFPTSIEEGDVVKQHYKTGGPPPGTTLNLELSVKAIKNGENYVVTLTEDYNTKVNGVEAISYWKYEVTQGEVSLLEKNEEGTSVNTIK